jgi:hypothetical protein
MDDLSNEIFVIATNRRDGALPDPVKIIDGELFHDVEAAHARFEHKQEEFGDSIGLYRALITMDARLDAHAAAEERQPGLRDLTDDQLMQLMRAMYESGRIDARSGSDLTDGQVYMQVQEDVADFIRDQFATQRPSR